MEYVLVYAEGPEFRPNPLVLVIKKDKPEFQKGRLNLLGGKVEPNEKIMDAAIRELKEESGLDATSIPICCGQIYGDWGTVHCFKIEVENMEINPGPDETEPVFWRHWSHLKDDPELLSNLRLIIPLMMTNTTGWKIKDSGSDTMEVTPNA